MKLTLILLTAAFLNVSAKAVSQNVSFSGNNVELKKVFDAIETQTGYAVFWSTDLLKAAKPVSLNVSNMPLVGVLDIVLKDQPFSYRIVEKTILLSEKVIKVSVDIKSADGVLMPPGNIQGRVTNAGGEPLAGASITVKEVSNLGVSTDINGYYKISTIAAGDYTLIISYVGYATKTTTIKINESSTTTVDFKLTPSLVNLDQLTVTSTLSARKIRAYPATIAVINQEDLKNRNLNNIVNVLEAVPGVIIQPGSEISNSGNSRVPSNVIIRGTSAGISAEINT